MSDGKTEAEAVANGKDAFKAWMSARKDAGKEIPVPFYCPDNVPEVSGKFVTRLPKSVHAKLTERAKAEGVSLNALVSVSTIEVVGFALILRRLPPNPSATYAGALIAERGSDEKIRGSLVKITM